MTRLRLTLALAAAAAALAVVPPAAGAYEHLGQQIGSQVLPQHWATLPIALTVDNGPTPIQSEIDAALTTWNDVGTAQDPWSTTTLAAVDFTKANFGTAWGNLDGDGKQEVVFDEDGSIIRDFGLVPASVNGFGLSGGVIDHGEAVIRDMYLLINGSRTDFDRRATEVHELGHTLGLAHSSVGWPIGKDGALSPELEAEVPTMHPFSIASNDRQSLEADDVASLSELYPNATFASTTGTISGVVTRCGSGDPVLGANVRAINVADPSIQLSRLTGFDGKTDGSYTINGVPPGDYFVVVEPLAGDQQYLDGLATFTRIDTDFTQEYLNKSKEDDCAQDTDPNDKESIPVGATGNASADFKVEGASLALVVDITGSMGPEIGAIKAGLDETISALSVLPGSFPKTAIVTFDDSAQIRTVSRDPARLKSVIDGLTTHSTPDCPEGSNAALMTAGRLLGTGGRAILVTDAESHPTGPSRQSVDEMYAAKGIRLNVLLSGSCPGAPPPAAARTAAGGPAQPLGAPPVANLETFAGAGAGPDEPKAPDVLGPENSVRTFSEESLFSGGLFSFQPEIKTGTVEVNTRYSNTLANIAISAATPAVATVNPSAVPRGTTLDVELSGSDTNFGAGSTVAVAGSGVSVLSASVVSPTRIVVRLAVDPGAATGFRDVTVTTDLGAGTTETAKGIGAVEVVGAPSAPTVLSVTPATVPVGSTRDVTISGGLTHFGAGSVASLGSGVTVNSLTVSSPTSLVAHVTVAPNAALGFHDVNVQTGGETAAEAVTGPLLVTAAPPAIARLTHASPASGVRGATVDVALDGADTSFASGTSVASVAGAGVEVLSTTVSSPTSAVARLRIAPDAALGFHDLKVTTGVEEAALVDGFEVRAPASAGGGGATPAPSVGSSGASARPSTCSDRAQPRAALLKGKKGASVKHGKPTLHGRASDTGCSAAIAVAGRVARVEVAISRKAGRKCRFVAAGGKLAKAHSCSKPVWLRAKGTASWSLALPRRLPRGSYTILVRARDAAGNVQAKPAKAALHVG